MSRRNSEAGFSLVELLVVMVLVGVVFATFSSFFTNYLTLYSKFQQQGTRFSELATQSQRMARVLRGITDINSLSANEISAYAYFSPNDDYTSLIHYYVATAGKSKQLMAEVTPMTANPPNGTLLSSQKRTYTIISDFAQPSGVNLFTYYDAGGGTMSLPIVNQHEVISIQVNLAAPGAYSGVDQTLPISVSLRNRKTNL